MPEQKNLCALIPTALHQRVTEEKGRLEQTTSQYITNLLTEYFTMKDEGGERTMPNTRTLAFQIPEELFQQIKAHLEQESGRLGRKVTITTGRKKGRLELEFYNMDDLNALLDLLNTLTPKRREGGTPNG